ncbi:DUF1905 domain-containing protein [Candidatus Saccharibacteria bacterium]|nr:DUF1905 domain-containing protein [Candidatus Saccharibacteria bacterium]
MAKIEQVTTKGGWHYVLIPLEIHKKLQEQAKKNGNVPVLITIRKTSWPTTTMSMGNGQWFVAIKAEIRKTEMLNAGDSVEVTIIPDSSRLNQT